MVVGVGSTNKAKVGTVEAIFARVFPNVELQVVGLAVSSDVSAQPMTAAATIEGAVNRARKSLAVVADEFAQSLTDGQTLCFGVGLEGGVETVEFSTGETKYFECGWMAVIDSAGRVGYGSSARFEMRGPLIHPILNEGKELADVIDSLTGLTDVRSGLGAMGILTDGHLGRQAAYEHGLLFALGPWLSSEKFWE
eukprot:ANDGO_07733.mRNA.1 Non-canonical purine NTP phosphatase